VFGAWYSERGTEATIFAYGNSEMNVAAADDLAVFAPAASKRKCETPGSIDPGVSP
jgi:hypothetical protein